MKDQIRPLLDYRLVTEVKNKMAEHNLSQKYVSLHWGVPGNFVSKFLDSQMKRINVEVLDKINAFLAEDHTNNKFGTQINALNTSVLLPRELYLNVKNKMVQEQIKNNYLQEYLGADQRWVTCFLRGDYVKIRKVHFEKLNAFLEHKYEAPPEPEPKPKKEAKVKVVKERKPNSQKGKTFDYQMPANFKPYQEMIEPRICIQESNWRKK